MMILRTVFLAVSAASLSRNLSLFLNSGCSTGYGKDRGEVTGGAPAASMFPCISMFAAVEC